MPWIIFETGRRFVSLRRVVLAFFSTGMGPEVHDARLFGLDKARIVSSGGHLALPVLDPGLEMMDFATNII